MSSITYNPSYSSIVGHNNINIPAFRPAYLSPRRSMRPTPPSYQHLVAESTQDQHFTEHTKEKIIFFINFRPDRQQHSTATPIFDTTIGHQLHHHDDNG